MYRTSRGWGLGVGGGEWVLVSLLSPSPPKPLPPGRVMRCVPLNSRFTRIKILNVLSPFRAKSTRWHEIRETHAPTPLLPVLGPACGSATYMRAEKPTQSINNDENQSVMPPSTSTGMVTDEAKILSTFSLKLIVNPNSNPSKD